MSKLIKMEIMTSNFLQRTLSCIILILLNLQFEQKQCFFILKKKKRNSFRKDVTWTHLSNFTAHASIEKKKNSLKLEVLKLQYK